MKKVLLYLFFVTVIVSCNSDVKSQSSSNTEQNVSAQSKLMSCSNFESRTNEESNVQLIDVRTKEEFEAGAISGAVNLNILDGTFQDNINTLDKEKPVYVYCAKGGRSAKAAKLLVQQGFKEVIDLKGGYSAYKIYESQK